MKKLLLIETGIVTCVCLLLGLGSTATAQITSPATNPEKKTMEHHASGTFEVDLTPQQPDEEIENPVVNRMTITKQFHGGLEAESKGQMLAIRTDVEGSAGYVAIERVTGTLAGHTGSFALQHSGTMTRGVPQLTVTVVPDSGTDELAGLKGTMTINIEGGKHFYEFEYTLPEGP